MAGLNERQTWLTPLIWIWMSTQWAASVTRAMEVMVISRGEVAHSLRRTSKKNSRNWRTARVFWRSG